VTPASIELAKRIVAAEAGGTRSSQEVGASGKRICEKLTTHLARLVGQVGVMTLVARSLTLTKATFPWIASVGKTPEDSRWDPLETCLADQDRDAALEALTVFLGLFIGLLGRLMGDSLVERLLHELWPAAPAGREKT
jgi:hypothetical protein